MQTLAPTPVLSKEDSRRARRRLILESALASGEQHMTVGVVLLGYALLLGANTFQIGLLSTAQMVGASFQLFSDTLLGKLGTRRRLGSAALTVVAIGRLLIGLLPVAAAWIAVGNLPWALLALLVVVSGATQTTEVVRLSWIADVVPGDRRGRFLGDRHVVAQLVGSGVAIAAAWLIDWQQTHSVARATVAAQSLFVVAAALGIGNVLTLRAVPEAVGAVRSRGGSWKSLVQPLRDRRFRPLALHAALWSFAGPLAGPFFNLYLIAVLKMPLGMVALYSFLGQIASLYSVRLWGKLADRYGNLPVLRLCVAAKTVFPVLWLMLWPAGDGLSRVLLYVAVAWVHLWRTFNSGQQLSTINLALRLAPQERSTQYLAAFRTLGNWVHAVSPAVGGLLASALQDAGWTQHLSLVALFVVSALARSVALAALALIREPRTASLRHVWRVLYRLPGVTGRGGWKPFVRFWGGPVWSGFAVVRTRLGVLIAQWRSALNGGDE